MTKPVDPLEAEPGRFAYDGLERAIHEKARLGILTCLMSHPGGLLFGELKELCSLSDGNLNRHLKVLQEEGLIEIWKGGEDQRPKTLCRITRSGQQRFASYLQVLEQVVSDAAAVAQAMSVGQPAARPLTGDWRPA